MKTLFALLSPMLFSINVHANQIAPSISITNLNCGVYEHSKNGLYILVFDACKKTPGTIFPFSIFSRTKSGWSESKYSIDLAGWPTSWGWIDQAKISDSGTLLVVHYQPAMGVKPVMAQLTVTSNMKSPPVFFPDMAGLCTSTYFDITYGRQIGRSSLDRLQMNGDLTFAEGRYVVDNDEENEFLFRLPDFGVVREIENHDASAGVYFSFLSSTLAAVGTSKFFPLDAPDHEVSLSQKAKPPFQVTPTAILFFDADGAFNTVNLNTEKDIVLNLKSVYGVGAQEYLSFLSDSQVQYCAGDVCRVADLGTDTVLREVPISAGNLPPCTGLDCDSMDIQAFSPNLKYGLGIGFGAYSGNFIEDLSTGAIVLSLKRDNPKLLRHEFGIINAFGDVFAIYDQGLGVFATN
jgi:hypothetical protein